MVKGVVIIQIELPELLNLMDSILMNHQKEDSLRLILWDEELREQQLKQN